MAKHPKPIPDGYHSITPYLYVKGAARAIDFYQHAFGANVRMRMDAPNGKVGHAELEIGNACIMLADEAPDMGAHSPETVGGTPVGLMLYVEDVDAVVAKAEKAGARVTRPIENQFYGDRLGCIEDPFGHSWYIATHVEDVEPAELERRAKARMSETA